VGEITPCHAQTNIVGLIGCLDDPVKSRLCPPTVLFNVTISEIAFAMKFAGAASRVM
jgi:hypothetical protein